MSLVLVIWEHSQLSEKACKSGGWGAEQHGKTKGERLSQQQSIHGGRGYISLGGTERRVVKWKLGENASPVQKLFQYEVLTRRQWGLLALPRYEYISAKRSGSSSRIHWNKK